MWQAELRNNNKLLSKNEFIPKPTSDYSFKTNKDSIPSLNQGSTSNVVKCATVHARDNEAENDSNECLPLLNSNASCCVGNKTVVEDNLLNNEELFENFNVQKQTIIEFPNENTCSTENNI